MFHTQYKIYFYVQQYHSYLSNQGYPLFFQDDSQSKTRILTLVLHFCKQEIHLQNMGHTSNTKLYLCHIQFGLAILASKITQLDRLLACSILYCDVKNTTMMIENQQCRC